MRKKRWNILAVVLMGLMVLVSACGGGTPAAKSDASKAAPAASAPAADLPTINWKFGGAVQQGHPFYNYAEEYIKRVGEISGGKMKLTHYPARQLGDENALMEQVNAGAVEMVQLTGAIVGGRSKANVAFFTPWLLRDFGEINDVYKSPAMRELLDAIEKDIPTMKLLMIGEVGLRSFITNFGNITDPSQLAKKRLRAVPSPPFLKFTELIGAVPTAIPYGEIYTAVQTKVVDGMDMDYAAMFLEKHYEVAPYVTISSHFPFPNFIVVNRAKWDALPPAAKQVFEQAAADAFAFNMKDAKAQEDKYISELKAKGVKVAPLGGLDKFVSMTKPLVNEWKETHPAAKKYIETVQAKYNR